MLQEGVVTPAAQIAVRAHPSMLRVQKWAMSFWETKGADADLSRSILVMGGGALSAVLITLWWLLLTGFSGEAAAAPQPGRRRRIRSGQRPFRPVWFPIARRPNGQCRCRCRWFRFRRNPWRR